MNLRLVAAISLLIAAPAFAQAQTGAPPPAPKPTMADVQKVVQQINGDKTKLQAYCDMNKLNDQVAQADQKKDEKALEALGQKADALARIIGPDYIKLMDGLDQVDENSAEGKAIAAAFDTLDKQCK